MGTIQPHDDVLVVTLRMVGFDQGSGVEIMYPELFKSLGLKLEDLDKYDVPLIKFDGKTTILNGMI